MVVRFRKKVTKKRGSRTYGYGSPKKHRGKGSKGGKGKAGVGKKAGHKAILLTQMGKGLGKQGFTMPPEAKTKYYVFSLKEIHAKLSLLKEEGYVNQQEKEYVIELIKYKRLPVKLILSNSPDSMKFFEEHKGIIKVTKATGGVKEFLESKGWTLETKSEA